VLHVADTCIRRLRRLATVESGVILDGEKEGRHPDDVGGDAGGQPCVYVTTAISLAEFMFMKKGQWVEL
jgi:hypothetical protein